MKFEIPKAQAGGLSIDELLERYESILPQVDDDLRSVAIQTRISRPTIPDGLNLEWTTWTKRLPTGEEITQVDPQIPEDLTEDRFAGPQLGKLHSFLVSWEGYVGNQLTRTRATKLTLEESLKDTTDECFLMYKSQGDSDALSKTKARVHPKSRDLRIILTSVKVREKLIQARFDTFENHRQNASREVTRRGQDHLAANIDYQQAPRWKDEPSSLWNNRKK